MYLYKQSQISCIKRNLRSAKWVSRAALVFVVFWISGMWIRIGCIKDPDPGSASASTRIRIHMRIHMQEVKRYLKVKTITHEYLTNFYSFSFYSIWIDKINLKFKHLFLLSVFGTFWAHFWRFFTPGSESGRSPIRRIRTIPDPHLIFETITFFCS